MTLEPGVYVEGVGGIRIEDDALGDTRAAAEILTTTSRESQRTLSKNDEGIKKHPANSDPLWCRESTSDN